MDKSAIEAIQAGIALETANTHLVAGNSEIVLPDGMEILSLDYLHPYKRRMTGTLLTASFSGFVQYVNDLVASGFEHGACFIDRDQMAATFIANYGTASEPGHCDLRAILSLKRTPEYAEILTKHGIIMNQQRFAEWCEEWRHLFMFTNDAETRQQIDTRQGLQAIRQIQIDVTASDNHEVQALSANRSTLESIEATSGNPLPHWLIFDIHPYECLAEYTLPARVHLRLKPKEPPSLFFCLQQLDKYIEVMAKEFADLLEAVITTTVYQGQFKPGL